MTPKEMRAMTARMNSAHVPAYALREDLKMALTELSELQDAYNEVTTALRDRAERAEADLAIADGVQHTMKVALERAEAALARVRDLCDRESQPFGDIRVPVARIRAAIEGGTQ